MHAHVFILPRSSDANAFASDLLEHIRNGPDTLTYDADEHIRIVRTPAATFIVCGCGWAETISDCVTFAHRETLQAFDLN